jgi:hypothetical protein
LFVVLLFENGNDAVGSAEKMGIVFSENVQEASF